MTALIQSFSVPADNDVEVEIIMDPDMDLTTLEGATIYWNAYPQAYSVPILDAPPVISKSSATGHGITLLPSPPTSCQLQINAADTVGLLRNYYHETTVVDVAGNKSTVNQGIFTVTETENRP